MTNEQWAEVGAGKAEGRMAKARTERAGRLFLPRNLTSEAAPSSH